MAKVLLTGILLAITSMGQAQHRASPRATAHTAVPPSSAALADFTFKSARAGEVMDPTTVGTCSPTDDGITGKLQCRGSDPVVAGVRLLLAPSYYFYNGRLTSMLFLYDNKGVNFLTFLGAFRGKYGAPCETATEKWESRGGTTVDNQTATWCFKTGKLKLEQIGPNLEYGIVSYEDDYGAPTKAAPQDF